MIMMREQCKADVSEYFTYQHSPILKSCLDYGRALKEGVKDASLGRQCNEDLLEELPSCRRWKLASQLPP